MTPIGIDRRDLDAVNSLLADAEQPLIWMDDIADAAAACDEPPVDADEIAVDIDHAVAAAPVADETATPFEPMDHSIVVTLLGGVEVTDRDGVPGQFERSKTVELIAWLATHRNHSTRGAARTALWELDVRDATFANVVSEARRALGLLVTPPDGNE
jgi:hypothetical protein